MDFPTPNVTLVTSLGHEVILPPSYVPSVGEIVSLWFPFIEHEGEGLIDEALKRFKALHGTKWRVNSVQTEYRQTRLFTIHTSIRLYASKAR